MREKIGASVAFDNFITQILPYFFLSRSLSLSLAADGSWFLSELQLETAVMSATCATIPHRAAKSSPMTYICLTLVSVSMDASREMGRLN